jgi:hypothetical protein
MDPEVLDKTEETAQPKKFIVIVDDPARGIMIQAGGITMEEGIVLITKGYFKFQAQFEDYIKTTI